MCEAGVCGIVVCYSSKQSGCFFFCPSCTQARRRLLQVVKMMIHEGGIVRCPNCGYGGMKDGACMEMHHCPGSPNCSWCYCCGRARNPCTYVLRTGSIPVFNSKEHQWLNLIVSVVKCEPTKINFCLCTGPVRCGEVSIFLENNPGWGRFSKPAVRAWSGL